MAKDKEKEEDAEAEGGKKKLIIIVIPVVILLAAAGWYFFLKADESGAPEALPEPTPGAVVKLEAITVNLAGGHFLKFGMALQPTASALEIDGSKALDAAIGEFSQMTLDELSAETGRIKAKEELVARIKLSYLPEGTDLAAATSTGSEASKEGTTDEGESKKTDTHSEEAEKEIEIEKLSGAEVIKMADALTVQPEIYDIYFTEFVMQ